MKLVAFMILLSGVLLAFLATSRHLNKPVAGPSDQTPSGSSNSLSSAPTPDESALRKIKTEQATGRFPFLVSSLCRDFLERYPESPHRAEVENILKQSQETITERESTVREPK
jgi:hypothetical protein